MASSSTSQNANAEQSFNEFYTEVKEIEKRDSVLTPKQQLERLTRPGSTYFNLNPFDVLQVDPDTPLPEIKQKFRRMSILVHPDKNLDDKERAQTCFDAVKKAWKTLEEEEGYQKCKAIVEEAKSRVDEMEKQKKKQMKKENRSASSLEDDPEKYRHAVYVQTCKLFADLERLRQEEEAKQVHEKKRKAQEEEEETERKKMNAEWNKNFEESRTERVSSWRDWKKGGKKSKGTFRPPKPKMESR